MADVEIKPLTEDTWPLLTELFGPDGVFDGCWCTWFMQSKKEMETRGGDGNRELMHGRVRSGTPPGLLAVEDGKALGWVAVAPRATYPRLKASMISRIDDPSPDLWTVTCFYVGEGGRRRGIGSSLLSAAVDFAKEHGARTVEGFPVDTSTRKFAEHELYHGTLAMFTGAGFELVERRGKSRAMVRRA